MLVFLRGRLLKLELEAGINSNITFVLTSEVEKLTVIKFLHFLKQIIPISALVLIILYELGIILVAIDNDKLPTFQFLELRLLQLHFESVDFL